MKTYEFICASCGHHQSYTLKPDGPKITYLISPIFGDDVIFFRCPSCGKNDFELQGDLDNDVKIVPQDGDKGIWAS